ncbi:MAG: valine--tRNA ligase [Rickettsiaceae bacterium]|nr:valine--tRNA ligase [Rickettsiaceae bacterium]
MKDFGNYDYSSAEAKWQKYWQENRIYAYKKDQGRSETFSVDTPPPTVSGHLHMGHIFSYTQADFIVRFQRMVGKNIFYPMGYDDNGLPTERLVEKLKKIKAHQLDREEFIKICKEVVQHEEDKFESLFKSLGLSVDWDLKYQTISENSAKVSQLSFLDLLEKGQLYRAHKPVLWDTVDRTALAQADTEDKEKNSFMHYVSFKDESESDLVIATTRPELLPACVCLLYHPDDERYKYLEGKFATSPLFKEKVPVISDDKVKQDKGTGLVMCCTFGDTTDVAWWSEHKLPLKIIIDESGKIKPGLKFQEPKANDVFAKLIGLNVIGAREVILEFLKEDGRLVKSVPVIQNVKCAERSGAPVEILSTLQWFIKTIEHKDILLKRSMELEWRPKHMKIRLDSWINSLNSDWCISRQRFFGVPVPVWYSKRKGEEGKIIIPDLDELPVDPQKHIPKGYQKHEVEPDRDVLDTWATSSISPQLSTCAINSKYNVTYEKHLSLFPFDLRPQAHEIIRTWAFYTILKAHLHENTLPWKNIMISGWCLADDKTKMSKSKGNIVSPVALIEKYGADPIRYWASSSRLGADTAFSEDLLKDGKRLVNKIWNASKYAASHFASFDLNDISITSLSLEELVQNGTISHEIDLWIISKMQAVLRNVSSAFLEYEYAEAVSSAEQFFWRDFCDNYLEITKSRCYNEASKDKSGQISALCTIYHVLKNLLLIFSPVVPHVTEEIYSIIYKSSGSQASIHAPGTWPLVYETLVNKENEGKIEKFIKILELVRRDKTSNQISIKKTVSAIILPNNLNFSAKVTEELKNVCNAVEIKYVDDFGNFKDVVSDGEYNIAIEY